MQFTILPLHLGFISLYHHSHTFYPLIHHTFSHDIPLGVHYMIAHYIYIYNIYIYIHVIPFGVHYIPLFSQYISHCISHTHSPHILSESPLLRPATALAYSQNIEAH